MKRLCLLFGVILSAFLIFTGCAKNGGDSGLDGDPSGYNPLPAGQETNVEEVSEQDPAELQRNKIPMVMVDGKLYFDTDEESTLNRKCGTMDGEITSTVDASETPTKDNQSNFGVGFGYQYGAGDTIEVFLDEKWIVFEHRKGDGNQVKFGDLWVDEYGLSEDTLEWLAWYNSLTKEEQLAISAIPPELIEERGLVTTEDAEAPVTEDGLCVYPPASAATE